MMRLDLMRLVAAAEVETVEVQVDLFGWRELLEQGGTGFESARPQRLAPAGRVGSSATDSGHVTGGECQGGGDDVLDLHGD